MKSLALAIGEELELTPGEQTALGRASELHDIGKIAIPDAILTKSGPLDKDEWEFMYQHTILGERIAAAAPPWHRSAEADNGYSNRRIPSGAMRHSGRRESFASSF